MGSVKLTKEGSMTLEDECRDAWERHKPSIRFGSGRTWRVSRTPRLCPVAQGESRVVDLKVETFSYSLEFSGDKMRVMGEFDGQKWPMTKWAARSPAGLAALKEQDRG